MNSMKKLEIKAPCSENWEKMQGDGKKRYCASCDHHVEDFTDKSVEEIIKTLESREGRTCGRLRTSQLNPIKKIAATVMVGAMLAGCQPEANVVGKISVPQPIEIDTTDQDEAEDLSQDISIDSSEISKEECMLNSDVFSLGEEMISTGILDMSSMEEMISTGILDMSLMGDIGIEHGIEGDLGQKLRDGLNNPNNE